MGIPNGNASGEAAAANVMRILTDRKLTRADLLARGVGIAKATLYDKLDKRPHTITIEELGRIAFALEVPMAELVKGI
jgi:DNA-binding Xre family transcriptional regulator